MAMQPDDNETNEPGSLSRRLFVTASAAAAGGLAFTGRETRAAIVRTDFSSLPPYGNGTLPPGVRSRTVNNVNGLTVHILEAGYETPTGRSSCCCTAFPNSSIAGAR
jgi:hypothetical protein